jgi:hypothetical protein
MNRRRRIKADTSQHKIAFWHNAQLQTSSLQNRCHVKTSLMHRSSCRDKNLVAQGAGAPRSRKTLHRCNCVMDGSGI